MSDTPKHDVMTYNAITGEVSYREFTDEERAEQYAATTDNLLNNDETEAE